MRIGFLSWLAEFLQRTACLTETSQIVKRRKRNSVTCLSTEQRVPAANGLRRGDAQGHPLLLRSLKPASPHRPTHAGCRVLQQGIEATGSGTRVQIDAADLLDKLLQRLQLLQTQQQRVVLH